MSMVFVGDDDPDTAIATRDASAPIATPQHRANISAAAQVEAQRAIAEVQAAMFVAQQNPRNERLAIDRIKNMCGRESLAKSALYSYARGGTSITGPSIRLAEAIAQRWGNLSFGIRELEQRADSSAVEAFCADLEMNNRSVKVFTVPHYRHTKNGKTRLTDPRDIYELVANNGARRLRACILAIIPADVTEEAVAQCHATLRASVKITPELLERTLEKFQAHGVSKEALEKFIQRRFDSITPALVVRLGTIYTSLEDGMSTAGEWFELESVTTSPPGGTKADQARAALEARTRPATPKPPAVPVPEEVAQDEAPALDLAPPADDVPPLIAEKPAVAKPPAEMSKSPVPVPSFLRNAIDSVAAELGVPPPVAADIERVTLNGQAMTAKLSERVIRALRDVAEGAK